MPLIAAGIAVGLLGFVALAWLRGGHSSGPQYVATGFDRPFGAVRGATAPDFTVETLEHGPFGLSAQRGTPTVMFFTASYCEPCIPQMQTLARVEKEVGADKLSVLVLDVDPTEGLEGLRRLKLRTGGSYPFALDEGNRVTLLYGVRALDTKMFIDKNGVLVDRVDGIPESDGQLRNRVANLLRGH